MCCAGPCGQPREIWAESERSIKHDLVSDIVSGDTYTDCRIERIIREISNTEVVVLSSIFVAVPTICPQASSDGDIEECGNSPGTSGCAPVRIRMRQPSLTGRVECLSRSDIAHRWK